MNVHTMKRVGALVLGLLGPQVSFATPPAAPQVTVGADIKQLHFDWDIVPRSNYYEFWFKANDGAPYVKFSELEPWQPQATNNISAHLLDWSQARYQIKACNFSGCTPSPELAVHDRMFESIGYFKPSGSYRNGNFGNSAAISEDGKTIAVFAGNEPVAGGNVASVYLFTKVNGAWHQQKRIVPSTTAPGLHNVGLVYPASGALSLSGDGNRLMTSMPLCLSADSSCRQMLSVWVRSGTTWTREYQVVGQSQFVVATAQMNEAGDRIVYRASNYNQPLEMLERTTAGWTKHAPIPQDPDGYGCGVWLSGDGATIARACSYNPTPSEEYQTHLVIARAPAWNIVYDFKLEWPSGHPYGGFAIDYAGTTVAFASSILVDYPLADQRPQVQVLRIADGDLSTSILHAGSWAPAEYGTFGRALALSRDGGLLAISNGHDRGLGRGVLSPPLLAGTVKTGATSIFELRPNGPRLRRTIKPESDRPDARLRDSLSFANNGRTLLIADPDDASRAMGINGDRDDTSLPGAGALWLY
ncbi:MAG TPA: hypothetical protein VK624_04555 [Steroidobacteraceae bacterium]|nr:hypothetical protein [Steroidobacteraceae bacterium]